MLVQSTTSQLELERRAFLCAGLTEIALNRYQRKRTNAELGIFLATAIRIERGYAVSERPRLGTPALLAYLF